MSIQTITLSNLSYNFAGHVDNSKKLAVQALDLKPSLAIEVTEQDSIEMSSGFLLRFTENNKAKYDKALVRVNGAWIEETETTKDNKKLERLSMSIGYAVNMSSVDFGQLKTKDPSQHAFVGQIREAFSAYRSKMMSAFKKALKDIVNERLGKKSERKPTAYMIDWMEKDWLKSLNSRLTTSKGRGDTTADKALVDDITAYAKKKIAEYKKTHQS